MQNFHGANADDKCIIRFEDDMLEILGCSNEA